MVNQSSSREEKASHTHTQGKNDAVQWNSTIALHKYFVVYIYIFFRDVSYDLLHLQRVPCRNWTYYLIQLALSWKPAVMTCPGDTVSDRIWSHSITHHKRLIIKQAPRFGELHFTLPSFPGQSQVWLVYFFWRGHRHYTHLTDHPRQSPGCSGRIVRTGA